jgi:hypothetical protein
VLNAIHFPFGDQAALADDEVPKDESAAARRPERMHGCVRELLLRGPIGFYRPDFGDDTPLGRPRIAEVCVRARIDQAAAVR